MYNKPHAVEKFRALLQCATVAGNDEEFIKFREILGKAYPNMSRVCEKREIPPKGLIYRWKGASSEKSVVFMSHYDVVPADNGDWLHPPFSGAVHDGKIWGRGTLDTKCTLCAVAESADSLIAEGFTPTCDVYMCFGGDEETTGESAVNIAEHLRKSGVKPFLVLDEGGAAVDGSIAGINRTCALVGVAEKGYMDAEFISKGAGGHSSLIGTAGGNPIVTMAEAIRRLKPDIFKPRFNKPLKMMVDAASEYTDIVYIKLLSRYPFTGKLMRKAFVRHLPEVEALTRTVGAVTRVSGGNADNIIPEYVRAVGNFRIISESSVAETVDIIKKTLSGLDVEVNILSALEPTKISPTSGIGFDALSRAIAATWEDAAIIPYLMMARSDSRSYEAVSDNIYRFSPVTMTKNERVTIHGVNECISAESFHKAIDFYMTLTRDLC